MTTTAPAIERTEPIAAGIADHDRALVKGIGLTSATLLVMGSVIGSAIFLTTGIMAERLPSASLILTAWTLGGLIALAGGLTYAEMGSMFPRSGGLYVFLEEAWGPLWGFLFGWAGVTVVLTGSVAAVAVGFAEYFAYFFPSLSTAREVLAVPLPGGTLRISAGQIVAALSVVVLGAVNYVGVRTGNAVQALLTVLKVIALAALPLLALAMFRVRPELTPIVPDVPRPAAAFGVAMIAVMWAYEGWYYVAFAAGEIKDAARNVPRALIYGVAALTVIYVVVNLSYFVALSIDEMSGVVRIAERAVTALIGDRGATIVAATVMVSTFGCNAAGVLASSRVCYAMAANGMFFPSASRVHPVYRTPHVAIVVTTVWSIVLTLSGSYEQLFTYVTFASLLFGVLGGLAIFRLRSIRPHAPRPYRTWGYPWIPLVFVLGSALLVFNTLVERPVESVAGLGLVALGLPAYRYWRRASGGA
jgi:APA family basic amino acid/polyamine antiporter